MLIKNFYKIAELNSNDLEIMATVELNPDHEVYKGHFPTQAVVPGVIQLQIIKEIIETHLGKKLFMGSLAQVKYLIPITPVEVPVLNISISIKSSEDDTFKTNVLIDFEDAVFTKAKITFSYL